MSIRLAISPASRSGLAAHVGVLISSDDGISADVLVMFVADYDGFPIGIDAK